MKAQLCCIGYLSLIILHLFIVVILGSQLFVYILVALQSL